MSFETFKTILLTILVGISLLLTFSLWNYQPNYDLLNPSHSDYVSEVDVGGIEETKRSVIQPSQIIFHQQEQIYGYKDPRELQSLYHHMQEWILEHYQLSTNSVLPDREPKIEVIFPIPLPVTLIKSLFTINGQDSLPNWSFQRMWITLNESYSTLNVHFQSIDGREQISYEVNNATAYTELVSLMENQQALVEYIAFETKEGAIYVPAKEVEMRSRSLALETISPTLFIDALFANPSLVSPNVSEAYYTDGQRGLDILNNRLYMEFINPIHSNRRDRDAVDLIDKSLLKINEHKGWTDDFKLDVIDLDQNAIRYQLYYDGYPVYSASGLTVMEQQWRNQELYKYSRPLFNLNNVLGSDVETLLSGQTILRYILEESHYNPAHIMDIRVGYKMEYIEDASYSVMMTPTWLIKYNGVWSEIMMTHYEEGGE
mgnify:CR=1 FL=1